MPVPAPPPPPSLLPPPLLFPFQRFSFSLPAPAPTPPAGSPILPENSLARLLPHWLAFDNHNASNFPCQTMVRLGEISPNERLVAELWNEPGDHEKAKHHTLAAYQWAWADGEPYVHRYELTKITDLLRQMNVPIPILSPYDPAKDEPLPWEAEVRAAIENLRAEKKAKRKKRQNGKGSE